MFDVQYFHPAGLDLVASSIVPALHWVMSVVILAEATNKLERTDPWKAGLSARQLAVVWLKVGAWLQLGLGAGFGLFRPAIALLTHTKGIAIGPFIVLNRPSVMDLLISGGFALLIVRSRLKEKPPCPCN